jgi:hypothetical protein
MFISADTDLGDGNSYFRFRVEHNVIHNCESSGIKIVEGRDCIIRNNTLAWSFGAAFWWGESTPQSETPGITVEDCIDSTVEYNIGAVTSTSSTGTTNSDNTLRDYHGPDLNGRASGNNYLCGVENLFEGELCGGKGDVLRKLRLKSGSISETRGHGSELTRAKTSTKDGIIVPVYQARQDMEPVITASRKDGHPAQFDFSAASSIDLDGSLTAGNATFSWDYGDTNTATGITPSTHTYSSYGDYIVTLTVTRNSDGASASTQTTVWAYDPHIFTIQFDASGINADLTYNGQPDTSKRCYLDTFGIDERSQFPGQIVEDPASSGNYAFNCTRASSNYFTVDSQDANWLKGRQQFTIKMEYKRTSATGEEDSQLWNFDGGGYAEFEDTNGRDFQVYIPTESNSGGVVWQRTGEIAANLDDTDYHIIYVSYDGVEPRVKVWVDASLVYNSTTAFGGAAWGPATQGGTMNLRFPSHTTEFTGYVREWSYWAQKEFGTP